MTEPGKPEPGAETERQGCGSLQRMVRPFGALDESDRIQVSSETWKPVTCECGKVLGYTHLRELPVPNVVEFIGAEEVATQIARRGETQQQTDRGVAL